MFPLPVSRSMVAWPPPSVPVSVFASSESPEKVNPEVADLLHGEENELILSLERQLGRQIVIYPNPQFHLEEIELIEILKD